MKNQVLDEKLKITNVLLVYISPSGVKTQTLLRLQHILDDFICFKCFYLRKKQKTLN